MEDSRAVLKEMLEYDSDLIPDIYINSALLGMISNECDYKRGKRLEGKVYEINGIPFEDIHTNSDEEYVEFDIVEKKETSHEKGKEFWENIVSEIGASDSPLVALTIQETNNGVIVNSNVFLLEENWHTIVRVDEAHVLCVVCSSLCSNDFQEHINSEEHRNSLQAHLPLDYYDLSIMRKVDGKYHCGVCNLVFTAAQLDHHLSSKVHEEHLLTAINKVSDILDVSSPECQSVYSQEDDVSEGFYDDYPNSPSHNGYMVDTDSDTDDSPTYASMASKPTKLPKYIEVETGVRKAWVQTDSWHMVVGHKANKFYCMVCRTEGPVRKKTEHCSKGQHLENLAKCTIVKKYKHHLVRRVDHKLLHCGHCNNLRLISDMEDHLELRHPMTKNANLNDPQKNKTNQANGSPAKSNKTTAVGQNQANPTRSNVIGQVQVNPMTTVIGQNQATIPNLAVGQNQINPASQRIEPIMVEIHIFGTRMVIPVLNFNTVLVGNGFYCCLCGQTLTIDTIQRHLSEIQHLANMKQVPFIPTYNCNLIRAIRDGVHCGICNVPLPYNLVFAHINQYTHVALLNNAVMASLIPPRPINQVNTTQSSNQFSILNELSETNTDSHKIQKPQVTNDIPQITLADTNSDVNTEELDSEDFVFVKVDNVSFKISVYSFNTLVSLGDGTRHCFLCSETLPADKLAEHVRRRDHQENIEKNKFMDKRKTSLLRQQYVTYHCGVCNVLLFSRELNTHLTWPVHIDNENHAITKKKDKKKIKDKKQYEATFQKEIMYTDAADPQIKILKAFTFTKEAVKKYKMVICRGNVARIEWNAWHGICKFGDGFKCCLCQKTFDSDLVGHTKSPEHAKATENFIKMYLPALIRSTNGNKLHCVTCNMELEKQDSVFGHMYSKSHKKMHKSILKSTSVAESFADCSRNVFSLDDS